MKLMSPWRYSTTSLERWCATRPKPSFSKKGSSRFGVGEANSTNSKPISPIGFSNRSVMCVLRRCGLFGRDVGLPDQPGVALLLGLEELDRGLGAHRVDDVFLLGHGLPGLGHVEGRHHRSVQPFDL